MVMNDSDMTTLISDGNRIGTAVALQHSMMNLEIKDTWDWKKVTLPISIEDLDAARKDFKEWVKSKPTGPLDGSWGALMHWWMDDRRPGWKRFDTIDRCYLSYAVGLPKNQIRVHRT